MVAAETILLIKCVAPSEPNILRGGGREQYYALHIYIHHNMARGHPGSVPSVEHACIFGGRHMARLRAARLRFLGRSPREPSMSTAKIISFRFFIRMAHTCKSPQRETRNKELIRIGEKSVPVHVARIW